MAKAPVIKFPRIEAGFYNVTMDGELVGYIMREVTDDKDTNWYIFDNATPELDVAMLHPKTAIDAPDGLFREAKENAKAYFLNRPAKAKVEVPAAPMKQEQWSEEVEVELDVMETESMLEDDNIVVVEDGDEELEFFEDELEFDSIEAESEELVMA